MFGSTEQDRREHSGQNLCLFLVIFHWDKYYESEFSKFQIKCRLLGGSERGLAAKLLMDSKESKDFECFT